MSLTFAHFTYLPGDICAEKMDTPLQATKEIDANGDGKPTQIVDGTTVTLSSIVKFTTDAPTKPDLLVITLSPGQEGLGTKPNELRFTLTVQETPEGLQQNYPVPEENPAVRVE